MEHLIKEFESAGLTLKPWHRADDIFALDIQGGAFLLQVGRGNHVQVQSVHKGMQQLVLVVREAAHVFSVEIPKNMVSPADVVVATVTKSRVRVVRKTPKETRHFLLGLDERHHPFASRLQGAAVTVQAAHEALKPDEIKGHAVSGKGKNSKASGKRDKKIVRQGEWFFVEPTRAEAALINEDLIEAKASIAAAHDGSLFHSGGRFRVRGRAHVADELVLVPAPRQVYVRGRVKHPDHATVTFQTWMRVLRNLEEETRPQGMTWVD